jgi:DNA polymerase-3 subunit epsilon
LSNIEKIVKKLRFKALKKDKFFNLLKNLFGMFENPQVVFETLKARGLPIEEVGDNIVLKTAKTPYKNQEFVVVDIETNGSKPHNSQVIEIGAVKFRGKKIVDTFESFIYANEVPEYISKLTGIYQKDLQNAPSQKEVLLKFKEFLGDAVFIAHNVGFDYNFLSQKLEEMGLEKLANRKLCSIDLAKKTIQSERYGLEFLNENLGINNSISHRAYADALTAYMVVQKSFKKIPKEVKTTEDLIEFSKKGVSKK